MTESRAKRVDLNLTIRLGFSTVYVNENLGRAEEQTSSFYIELQ